MPKKLFVSPAQPRRAETRRSPTAVQPSLPPMPVLIARNSKGGAVLTVHVQPKAARTVCVGVHGEALKVRVAAPPVAGAANRELIRFLADALSLPTSAVHIESGEAGRHKRVRFEGTTAAEVLARLIPGATNE